MVGSNNRNKLCIAGLSTRVLSLTPFHDKDFEVWSLNDRFNLIERFDKWFELHTSNFFGGTDWYAMPGNEKYFEFLKSCGSNLVKQRYDNNLPLAEIQDIPYKNIDITSSIMWMILQAIKEKRFNTIVITGVDLTREEEYAEQRDGVHFAIDEAKKNGIDVYVPSNSFLIQNMPDIRPVKLIKVKYVPEYAIKNTGYIYGL